MSSNAALKKAEDDTLAEILTWVQEVVEGRGDSAAQMVVSVVLGCIPYVGQAIDVYNILRSLYTLTRAPAAVDGWISLVLSLIAIVPVFGDALKNVFMMLRNGKKMGRILDSLPNKVRGDIEKWFRHLNWAQYARELTKSVDDILAGMVDVLEYRVTNWVLGRQGVQKLVKQLQELKSLASRKIDEAMGNLRQAHQRALHDPLPTTSGSSSIGTSTAKLPTPGSQTGGTVRHTSAGTATPSSGTANATKRQSDRSTLSRSQLGASGEHIADYYFVKRQRNRSKVSFNGHLFEMRQPGHQGIDHVWHGARLPHGYRISDTKGTGGPFHKLETAKAVYQALEYGIDAYLGEQDEKKAKGAVNSKVTADGKQMSHRWIAKKLATAKLLPAHASTLLPKVSAWRRNDFKLGASTDISEDGDVTRTLVRCPYDRSIVTVVGPNHNTHEKSKGNSSGRCAKAATSHQIATEFILPNSILPK
ncbi:hypothetical protein [Stenotrophomonas sp. 24(2023)]|uniref:hypothetical protein n=1 Tax=Stenotrophomonas sp. 24(2023) TaxID=3068324 RepID=UPI0027DF7ACD|nr:hypothetical protein [Stenotrophomonas sp. 24(2023)]WMJ69555.1 hypothetical protein Q9R17_00125 [Stenotrophomonas sp. 24(2023)]